MSILLNIDTTTEIATVCISKEDFILYSLSNNNKKEHASFVQTAVKELLNKSGLSFKDMVAISVTEGPGSYTGIRVGMASAKGFCYALNIPLITISTLEVMTLSAIIILAITDTSTLYCPVIDARRMEVFTGLYNNEVKEILKPCATIVTADFLKNHLQNHEITFFGSGSFKIKPLLNNKKAFFKNINILPEALARLSFQKLQKKIFTNYVNNSPLYIKDFHT